MSVLSDLLARKAAIVAELASGSASKPTSTINGQTVNWTEYRKSLLDELITLNQLINVENPFLFRTQAL